MSTIALKTIPKIIAKLLFIVCVGLLILGLITAESIPGTLWASGVEDIPLPTKVPLVAKVDPLVPTGAAKTQNSYSASINLFGVIPIGSARVELAGDDYVILGGYPFGIKILAEGVLVVGFNDVPTDSGTVNPAEEAGLQEGDLVLAVDGATVSTNGQLQSFIEQSGGDVITLSVEREGKNFEITLTPVLASDGKYRAGMWVRDSTAGLGTMTFYHPVSGIYGGLGHAVCDSDTGEVMSLLTGEIVGAKVLGINKAAAGTPGEIKGTLLDSQKIGSILQNCHHGVYGKLREVPVTGQTVRVAHKQEITTGKAQILCCVSGEYAYYDCEIEKINLNEGSVQNLVIRVTDADLLAATGGIVQGMSGSPIVQNGNLVGAVTHVFVNQPEKGYGIFAETMLATAQSVANGQIKEAG